MESIANAHFVRPSTMIMIYWVDIYNPLELQQD